MDTLLNYLVFRRIAFSFWLIAASQFSIPALAQPIAEAVPRAVIAESDWLPLFGEMRINGRSVLIQATQSVLSPTQLQARLKREWEQQGFRVQESMSGEWQIVSRIIGSHVEVVQLRAASQGSELLRHRASLGHANQAMPTPAWLGAAGVVVFASDSTSSIERGKSWLIELAGGATIEAMVAHLQRKGFQEHPIAQRISKVQMQRLGLFDASKLQLQASAPIVLTRAGQHQLLLQHFFDRGRNLVLVNEIETFNKQTSLESKK